MKTITVSAQLLREALELWRQADYYWSQEFGPVPASVEAWAMEVHSATFKELADLLRAAGC